AGCPVLDETREQSTKGAPRLFFDDPPKTFQAKCLEKTPIIQGTAVHTPLTITNDDLLTSLLFVTLMRKMVSPETLSGTLEFDGSGIETRDLPFSRTGMSEWIF
ncbi:hypothetical protein, partial [Pseudomonas savastanoi]